MLAGVSIGAASLVLAASPLNAQAVNGTPTPQFGIGGISRSTPGLDAVFVTGSEALVDWTASDSGGVFLPEGNTLRFIYDGSAPYTVLNRVTDTAVGGPLSISGTVESSSLGKVWFYNAGGWVVGPKGVFNVGSLVLTSLPIAVDPATDTVSRLYGDKNEIRFGSALDPKSSVTIQSGAQINASLANSSYVALVAPRVEQAGTVSVNGSAAYVAAQAATMTINSGLFDIVVDSGSDDLEGVVHTGTTKWPANASSTDANHRVYLVAVPKNQAMTAVVSGSLGYDGATSASVVDGSIVLSAGYNVIGGDVVSTNPVGGDASLAISGLTVGQKGATTNLTGLATGDVTIDARGSTTSVRGSVDLVARGNISATIDKTNALLVDSDLSLGSLNGAKAGNVSVSVAGGGLLAVGGTLDLYSIATGAIQTDPLNGDALLAASVGEDAVSGNVRLTVNDANFSLGGSALTSIATSGVGELSAGSATSGSVSINIAQTAGATATFGGSLGDVSLYTNAANGTFGPQSPIRGGNSVSGAATLAVNGGIFDATSISLGSDAVTYAGSEAIPLDATAGAVTLSFANANGTFFTGGINAGNFASASDGGIATLGDVSLSYDNVQSATSDSIGSIDLQSFAFGNLVTPNTVSLSLSGGSSLETYDSVVSLFAQGRNSTGAQLAGNVAFLADASTLNAARLDMTSQALGGDSGSDAVGGNVSAILRNGANLALGNLASLRSTARGGNGPDGGNGTGGDVSFTLADSSFTGDLGLSSNGVAGQRSDAGGRSGIGQGGKVSFSQTGKAASFLGNTVTLDSLGQGGRPAISARTGLVAQAGDGAAGVGGDASFSVAEGTFRASSLTVGANGEGGNAQNVAGFAPGTGGSGSGGSAALSVTGGLLTVNTVDVTASGFGGDGAQSSDALGIVGGIGGAGTGGSATVNLTGGTLQTQGLTIEANGNKSQFDGFEFSYFGNGGNDFFGTGAGGAGGVGTGGNALLTVDGGTLGEVTLSSAGLPVTVTVNAIGEGGAGGYAFTMATGAGNRSGAGGDGQGGTAAIRHLSGTLDAQTIGIDATGLGGLPGNDAATVGEFALNAGKGGDGAGGTSTFEIATDFASTTLSGSTRSVDVRADGIGQAGESGLIGGAGGSGTGGTARILATGGNSSLSAPVLSAEGMGKAGGNSTDGYRGGAGGSGTGGQALVAVIGDGTRLGVDNASLRVSGTGGVGGRGGLGSDPVDEAGDGGDGGAGTGGAIGLVASNFGQLSISGTAGSSFAASGTGGKGGLGGNSAFNGWRTLGDGGDGGIGRGGTFDALAESGGTVTFDDLTLTLNGQGGAGGSFASLDVSGTYDQSVGGAGGAGFGGAINLQAVGLDSRLEAPSLVADATGRGGAGVDGFGYAADGSSANGSAGGSATGGNISILADAGGAIALATGDGNVALSANALGGNGGRAFAAITAPTGIGGNGGNGGDSGAGTGGTIAITASDSGNASLGLLGTVTLSANGTGGLAGLGGDGANSTAPVTLGGSGGNNGLANAGRGGAISVGATGATARFGTLAVNATGETFDRPFGGAGGSGTSGLGLPGSSAFVTPSGGTVSFSSADLGTASTGSLVAGDTSVDVTSKRTFPLASGAFIKELGGAISLTSSSTATTDAMRFASFSGNAAGSGAGFSDPAISLTALSGPIAFDGDLTLLSAGAIALSVGDGLTVGAGGAARFVSDTGIDIAATGTGRFSANSIRLETLGSVGITSSSCATATCRPIEAATSLVVDAQGNFAISGPAVVAGLGSLDVYAFGNVTGSANSGYLSNGSLRVRAGSNATIRNASGSSLDLEAGAVPDGVTLYYNGLLTLGEAAGGGAFNATGDIVFASGGGIAVTNGNSFSAGRGIDVRSGNDIVVGQNNSFTANTTATVPGLPVRFAAGSLTLQYSLAPTDIAALSFGSGTTVAAGTGAIAISGAAIDARVASFTGASFRADVLQTLGLASPRRNNSERLDPACLEGAICIGNVDVTGTVRIGNTDTVPLDIRAVGRIAGSDVRLLATGNVTLEGVGRVSQIVASGNLSIRSVSREIALLGGAVVEGGTVRFAAGTNISGTGNITATVDDVGLFAGGDIDAASLTAARELTSDLAAGGVAEGAFSTIGALRVGTLTLGANANITAGKSIEIGALSLGGFSGTLKAGTLLDLGSTTEVQDLSLTAATTVRFTSPSVGGNLAISGQSVSGTSAQADGTLSITSDELTVDQLQSAGDLTLTIANTAALGLVGSTGGSVFIDPATLTFDAITSANAISLAGGTITGGTLDAGTGIDVNASGALTLASAKAGTTLSLVADSLQSGALDAGSNLSLTVTKGATLTGAATSAGYITAGFGTLDFTTLDTAGLVSLEGTDLSGNGITSGTSLTALLTGDYAVTSAEAGTSLALQAATATATSLSAGANLDATVTGLADLAGVTATGDLTLTAGSLLSTTITAGGPVDIGVSGNASVGSASSGTTLTADVGTLDAGDLVAGTVLSLKAATTASITGKAQAGTDATINAASLVGGSFIASGDLGITTTGDASFVDASAGGTLTVSSADLSFNSLAGKTVGVTAANVLGNQIALTDALTINATGNVTLALIGPTAGTVDIKAANLSLDLISAGDLGVDVSGNARLGAVLGSGAVTLSADNLLVDNLSAVGTVSLSGTGINAGTILAESDLGITATADVAIDRAAAGGTLNITAAGLAANTLAAAGDLTLQVTNTAALGTVTSSGGSVVIDPALLTFSAINASGDITLSGGTITGGTLEAGGAIDATATAGLTLTTALSGTTLGLAGANIDAANLTAGTDLTLTATNSINIATAASAPRTLTLSAPDIAFKLLEGGRATLTGGQVTGGDFTGESLSVDITGALALGNAVGDHFDLKAGSIAASSIQGVTSGLGFDVALTATGGITVGSVSSGNDLLISSASLDATTLDAVRSITVNASGTANIGGAVSSLVSITAGNLGLDLVDAKDVTIDVTGTATLGSINASTGTVAITAGTLSFDNIQSLTTTSLTAGSVTGNTVGAGTVLTVRSAGSVNLADVTAGSVDLAVGDLQIGSLLTTNLAALRADTMANIGTANVGSLDYRAASASFGTIDTTGAASIIGGTVSGNALNAGTLLSITATDLNALTLAANGNVTLAVTNTATLGTVTSSGGSVAIDPATLTFDAVTASGDIALSGGTITGGTLDAGASIGLTATGALTLTSAKSGTTLSLTADSLRAGGLDAGSDLNLATTADITLSDIANAGGAVRATFSTFEFVGLNAGGLLDLAGTDLVGTNLGGPSISAGGDASIALTGRYAVTGLTVDGNLLFGAQTASGAAIDVIGNADLNVAGLTSVSTYFAGGTLSLTAGELSALALSGGNVDARIAGAATLDSGDAGANFALSAASLNAGTFRTGGDLSLSTTGSLTISGDVNAAGNLAIVAGDLDAFSLAADGGIDLNVSNNANVDFAVAGQLLHVVAGGLSLQSLSAADIAIDAGSVSGDGVSAANSLSIISTGLVDLGAALAGGALSIASRNLTASIVQSRGGNVSLSVGALANLGDVSALAGDISATAGRLNFVSASASGQVQLGGVVIGGGVVNAGTSALVSATNSMVLDTITAGAGVDLNGGDIDINAVNAGTFADYAGRDVRVGTTKAGTFATVATRNFAFDALSATDNVGIRTTRDIVGGTIDAGTTLDIDATGVVSLDVARSGDALRARFSTLGFNLLDAGGRLDLAGTDLTGTNIVAGGNALIALTGSYAVGSITGVGQLDLTAKSARSNTIAIDGNVSLTVADTAALGTITSNTGSVTIDPALLTFDAITAAGDIALSGGTITGGTLEAGAAIGVTASGALTLASAKAGTNLALGADTLQSGALDASGNIALTVAKTAALTGVANAGADFSSTAGSLDFTTINAGAAAIFGGGSINGTLVDAKGAVSASLSAGATLDSVNSGTTLAIGADSISATTLTAGTGLSLFANKTMAIGTATAGGDASLNAASIQFDSVSSTGLAAIAGGTVAGGILAGTGGIDIAVTGPVTLTSATSGAGLTIDAASLVTTSLTAAGDARLTATGNLDLGTTQAGGSLYAQGLDLSFLSLTGQTVELAGRTITGGTIDARSTLLVQADGLARLDRAQAGSTAEFYVGSLELPEIFAGDVAVGARGPAKLGRIDAAGIVSIAANSLEFSAINAAGPASISAGSITGGTISGRFGVSLNSDGAIAISSARASRSLTVSGASVTADSLSSEDSLIVHATGNVSVGALYGALAAAIDGNEITFDIASSDAVVGITGTSVKGGRIDTPGSVFVSATGNVALTAVDAGFGVQIAANTLDLPSLQAGRDVRLTITNTATLGTVTSTGGSVTIDPTLLTFSSITSANAISLSGGTITGGTLDAGTSIDVNATGNLVLDLADAGTTLSLVGANVEVGSLLSGGSSSVSAQDLVRITSAINSGGDISVTAARFTTPLLQSNSGNVSLTISGRADLTNIIAFGGDLTINAGTLRFTSAGALGAVRLGGADLAGTTVTSGTSTNIAAGTVANIGTVTAGSSVTLGGPNVTVTKVTAGTFADFDGRAINVAETTAGTTAFIDARDFTFSKLTAGESVEILSSGNTTGGTIDAGTTLKISARGDVNLDDAKAGGAITIGAANINALTITGDAGLSLTATNAIDLGTVKVLGAFDLSGASLVLSSSSSGLDSTFSLTGNATIGTVAAGLASTGQNLVQVVVQALGNSFTGGTLVPVFDVVQGQTITVSSSTNDLWSAGFLPRFSDGDGLIAFRLATAQDDSGVQPGTQIGAAFGNLTIGNFSAPFGALVGQIGNQNVLIGANGTVTAPATGTLSVGYWDSNAGDNTGSIAFTFGNGTGGGGASNPANVSISTGGNLTVSSANASSAITLDAAGALKLDSADAGTALSLTGNTIDAGTLKAGTDITLASTGASVIGSATAGGRFSADIGALDFTLIDAVGAVDIASLAGVGGGDIRSGASIVVDASGSITIRDASAATDLALTSGATGDISARALAAGGSIGIEGRDTTLGSAAAGGNFSAAVRSLASPSITAGATFTVSGTGAVELGTASAGSALSVNSQTLTFTRMSSGGTLLVGTSGDVSGGDLVATGTMRINTGTGRFTYGTLDGGDIAIVGGSASGGSIRVRAGDLNLGVAGEANVGAIDASGNVAIDAQRLVFSTISAGGTFGTTNRSMTGTSISVGNDVSISSQGDIALAGLTGASAQIRSAGIVNITGVQLSGVISVSADAVGLDALGDLAIRTIAADRGNVDVTAEGSITGNTINALGDINLLARNGDVVISHLSAGYSNVFGGSVRPQGTVTAGAIGQGNIDIVANGDIVINDVADAAKAFTMNAGNTIRINGLATGATMDLTSADLEIGASGRLGEAAHTDAITLRNTGQGPLRLGDNIASTVSGYAISQAEFARIRSRGDLTIRANQALLVGDLAVVAQAGTVQGQIGENGTLSLRSGSLASFLGALSMTNAGGNTLAINSQSGVFLDAATGSIRLLEGTVGGGALAISGTGIAMVTRSALNDISQLTDTALITDRLGLNDGVADGRTLVEADTIQLRSDRDVYIQNTSLGTRLDDRRGLVARALRIGSRDGSQLDIVINGIVNGQVGVDAIEQITFEEAFTDLSSVNGCVIVNANTCNKLPFEIIELRDLVEEVLKSDPEDSALQVTDSFTKTTLIQLNQIAPAGFEPLIDEPVTGTGNDDLLGEGKQDGE